MRNEFGGYEASQFQNNFTKEENQNFTARFGEITSAMAAAQTSGLSVDDEQVQELIRQHYEFCLQFWTPNKTAYKALAQGYLLPSPYRDAYEAVNAGLAKYHHDAIVIWANKNLV